MESPINPKTGYRDGINYTFGKSDVAIILAKKLIEADKIDFEKGEIKTLRSGRLHKISKILINLNRGFEALLSIDPQIEHRAKIRRHFIRDWRDKHITLAHNSLSVEDGLTYLLNIISARHKEALRKHEKSKLRRSKTRS